jgi:hypothetical protein
VSAAELTEAEKELAAAGARLFAAINWRDRLLAMANIDTDELRRAQEAVAAFGAEFRQALAVAAGPVRDGGALAVTRPPLTQYQRIALECLVNGGELWLHGSPKESEVTLHQGALVRRLRRDDFGALLQNGLIQPARAVGASTPYEITETGRKRLGDEQ